MLLTEKIYTMLNFIMLNLSTIKKEEKTITTDKYSINYQLNLNVFPGI